MIDQMIGNALPPTSTVKISGSPVSRWSQTPRRAPMNPTAIATSNPPRENPAMACATAPQIAAIRSRRRKSRTLMVNLTKVRTANAVRVGR